MIRFQNVNKYFESFHAVKDVSFKINKGETLVLHILTFLVKISPFVPS